MLQIDISKIKLDIIKPWVTDRITEMLGVDDDVVVDYVFNQLESEKVSLPKTINLHEKHCCCKFHHLPLLFYYAVLIQIV